MASAPGGCEQSRHIMTRKALYYIIKQCTAKSFIRKLQYMEEYVMNLTKCPQSHQKDIKHKLSHFKSQFKAKWEAAHKKETAFFKNNDVWLNGSLVFPMFSLPRSGRPLVPFRDSSERSKRRKTQNLRDQASHETLTFAAQMTLRASGMVDASKVVKEITQSPRRATQYRKAYIKAQEKVQRTTFQALSVFVEAGLTRRQYELIRMADDTYPCYSILQRAKAECYPNRESYKVTATCAEVKLQSILDHTASRLILYLEDILDRFTSEEKNNLILLSKWGCDGSQQSQFKQKFEKEADTDANIFQSSFVPLRLICTIAGETKTIWQNPTPSSPRFCRPIRIRFIHETSDVTNEEIDYMENQIKELQETKITVTNGNVQVKHTLMFTMVDGKVCNAATATKSTQRCYICNDTSKDFNNISKKREIKKENLKFGLSVLHARIRFFESILHLSYKLPIKKWQARTPDEKIKISERKTIIQNAFKKETGLLVDFPKAGFGNTNDGNTARRFFSDPEVSSRITGVNEALIKKLKVILETISSGHKIDTHKFKIFALQTAELYVRLYPWYPMTPTMHKVLIHGPQIISEAILPIGQLSEEAAEARNKHFRLFRQNYARKYSREACNMDVINRLFLSSDPLLSCMRPMARKKSKPFSSETLNMLLPDEYVHMGENVANVSDTEDGSITSDEEGWI